MDCVSGQDISGSVTSAALAAFVGAQVDCGTATADSAVIQPSEVDVTDTASVSADDDTVTALVASAGADMDMAACTSQVSVKQALLSSRASETTRLNAV